MTPLTRIFHFERDGQNLIIIPQRDLSEIEFIDLEGGARDLLQMLGEGTVKNVIMDFHKTAYFGSTALGFFIKVWKRVRDKQGRMAFCCVSGHERETLRLTCLDGLWPVCASREEAIKAVQG